MATIEYDANGNLILNDPDALGMIQAVSRHNCLQTLKMQIDRVKHFQERIKEKSYDPKTVAIIIANVDTKIGNQIADMLMPNYDWAAISAKGEVPFARGIVMREGFAVGIPDLMEAVNPVIIGDHDIIALFQDGDY